MHTDKQGSRLAVLQAAWQTRAWDSSQLTDQLTYLEVCRQLVHMDKQGSRLVVLQAAWQMGKQDSRQVVIQAAWQAYTRYCKQQRCTQVVAYGYAKEQLACRLSASDSWPTTRLKVFGMPSSVSIAPMWPVLQGAVRIK